MGRPEHVLSRSLLERGSAQAAPRVPPPPTPSRSWVKPPHVAWRRLLSWGQSATPVHGGYEESPYAYREESPPAAGTNWKGIAYVLTVLLGVVSASLTYVLMNHGDRNASASASDSNSPMLALQTATGTIANDRPSSTSPSPSTSAHRSGQAGSQTPARASAQPVQANVPGMPADAQQVIAQALAPDSPQKTAAQPYQPPPTQQAQRYTQNQAMPQGEPYRPAQPAQQTQQQTQLAMQNQQSQQNQPWRRAQQHAANTPQQKAPDEAQQASERVAYELRVARASLDRNNLGPARAALGRALEIQPHNADALQMHADLESREFQRDSILAAARSCIAQDQWTCVWRDAGKALVIDGSSSEAKTMLTQAMTQSELDTRTGATRVPRPPGAP